MSANVYSVVLSNGLLEFLGSEGERSNFISMILEKKAKSPKLNHVKMGVNRTRTSRIGIIENVSEVIIVQYRASGFGFTAGFESEMERVEND